jgi:hypothetical protein
MWSWRKVLLFCWPVTLLLTLAADYCTGPLVRFPTVLLLTIIPCTWWNGVRWGTFYALIAPVLQFVLDTRLSPIATPVPVLQEAANVMIRGSVFLLIAFLVHRVRVQKLALSEKVRALSDLLPVCSSCKRIRNPEGEWEKLESYMENWEMHTEEGSEPKSHLGLCPDCAKQRKAEVVEEK